MKRPSFQFYPGDWQGNSKLRRCNRVEKSVWLDVLCLMHDSEEYGVLRWPLKDIAQAIGCKVSELQSISSKGVLKGGDDVCSAFIFTPRHAGKDGDPVTLLEQQAGPVWFSSRMVRDEYIRSQRGKDTRFGEDKEQPKPKPKGGIGDAFGAGQGDGPSSSSSTSLTTLSNANALEAANAAPVPDCPHEQIIALYHELLPACPRVSEWHDTRQGYLRARWRDKAKPNGVTAGYTTVEAGLAWWRRFLGFCGDSKFLTGQAEGRDGKPPFVATLEWIVRPTNFSKIIEGNYHR